MPVPLTASIRRTLFFLFFLSGGAALVYQVVWTRMAFAFFGVITPVLSLVLSMFMLGLSAGAWLGGMVAARFARKTRLSPLFFYAIAELFIGLSAWAVPELFSSGARLLLSAGEMSSSLYLWLSAVVLSVAILPWCVLMGTTFPFVMAFIRTRGEQNRESFSFLYLANVLGAVTGTLFTAFVFVETLGFTRTLWVAAFGNFLVAGIALLLGILDRSPVRGSEGTQPLSGTEVTTRGEERPRFLRWMLFLTGFSAMAMEVVWARAFTPMLRTQVYAFALVVFAYLSATFMGSWWYRRHLRIGRSWSTAALLGILAVATFLPILINDLRVLTDRPALWRTLSKAVLLLSICPLCAALGYFTPRLVDIDSQGRSCHRGTRLRHQRSGMHRGAALRLLCVAPVDGRATRFDSPWSSVSRPLFRQCPNLFYPKPACYRRGRWSPSFLVALFRGGLFRLHRAPHWKHGDAPGLRGFGGFRGRGARETSFRERDRDDNSGSRHEIHGASPFGSAYRPAGIRAYYLFWNGHDLPVRLELGSGDDGG